MKEKLENRQTKQKWGQVQDPNSCETGEKRTKRQNCHRQQNIPILNVFKVAQVSETPIATKTKNSQGRNAAVDKKHIGLNEQVFFT